MAYHDLNSPHTHTQPRAHTQITSAVSLISAWPRPRHHCHLIRIASTRVDSTSASLARTQKPPASPYYINLPLELPSVTTGRHRLLHPPALATTDCPGRQHYPSPITRRPYLVTCLSRLYLTHPVPFPPHRTTLQRTAPHGIEAHTTPSASHGAIACLTTARRAFMTLRLPSTRQQQHVDQPS